MKRLELEIYLVMTMNVYFEWNMCYVKMLSKSSFLRFGAPVKFLRSEKTLSLGAFHEFKNLNSGGSISCYLWGLPDTNPTRYLGYIKSKKYFPWGPLSFHGKEISFGHSRHKAAIKSILHCKEQAIEY